MCAFLALMMLFLCFGCGGDVPQSDQWELKQTEQNIAEEKNGLRLQVAEVDAAGNCASFFVTNGSDRVWYCGMDFVLQVKVDGVWYEIALYADHSAEEVVLQPGEVKFFDFYWDVPYGKLPEGAYRLVKEFYGNGALQKITGWTLGCEFVIE